MIIWGYFVFQSQASYEVPCCVKGIVNYLLTLMLFQNASGEDKRRILGNLHIVIFHTMTIRLQNEQKQHKKSNIKVGQMTHALYL